MDRRAIPSQPKSHTLNHKQTTQFIRRESLAEVKVQLANFKKFRKLTDPWVNRALQYALLSLKQSKVKPVITPANLALSSVFGKGQKSKNGPRRPRADRSGFVIILEEMLHKNPRSGE